MKETRYTSAYGSEDAYPHLNFFGWGSRLITRSRSSDSGPEPAPQPTDQITQLTETSCFPGNGHWHVNFFGWGSWEAEGGW